MPRTTSRTRNLREQYTPTQVDEEGDLEAEMLISVLPEQYVEIGTKILNKCAKQGKSGAKPPFAQISL